MNLPDVRFTPNAIPVKRVLVKKIHTRTYSLKTKISKKKMELD